MPSHNIFRRATPEHLAFAGSLLLSAIAVVSNPTLNRDGILYVETSHEFLNSGLFAAAQLFNWPFLSVLMAFFSKITGLSFEAAGHVINSLLMAGACSLLVSSARRINSQSAWATCLVVLALPGLNDYRNELLREYGYWFFCSLSLWLALKWNESGSQKGAVFAQIAIVMAALFRAEALIFFSALVVWQLFKSPSESRLRRSLIIGAVPLTAVVFGVLLILSGQFNAGSRLSSFANYLNITTKLSLFESKTTVLAGALIPYARPQASNILLWGSLAIIPVKFIGQLGIFVIPIIILSYRNRLKSAVAAYSLFSWALLAQILLLSTFVIDMQFLAGRYVATLCLLSVPLVGYATSSLMRDAPRLRKPIVAICIVVMLNNVISLNSGYAHRIEAGRWLATHASEGSTTYVEGTRLKYYAGWRPFPETDANARPGIAGDLRQGKYEIAAFEVSRHDPDIEPWLKENGFMVIERFENARRDAVIIAAPSRAKPEQGVTK